MSDRPILITRDWLYQAVGAALPADHGFVALPRFNPDPMALSGMVKVHFGVRCRCTTAAVVSIEASAHKSETQVRAVLGSLVLNLLAQRDRFLKMPCTAHRHLRTPPGSVPGTERPGSVL